MLFNSPVFLFGFLPVVVFAFYAFGRVMGRRVALLFLIAASLFFYGWWNPAYLILILASIGINFTLGNLLERDELSNSIRKAVLILGLTINLGALAYYKYTSFLVENLADFLGVAWQTPGIELPLAISFFTFQQVAYIVDAYRRDERERSLPRYSLFVVFFPQLIAGPIVHHKEMMPQFAREGLLTPHTRRFSIGLSILSIGLFKKVVIADRLAVWASPVFDGVAAGLPVTVLEAWVAVFAYTFQLYFDFSGYSDMAIGLGWLFGVRLPLNFFSPYRSTSIIEFWRRWHITLSRFLREYLYFSLGGNRRGSVRRYLNLFLTMLLGGIWHGAGWTFVIWGALHGGMLIVNHAWRARPDFLVVRLPSPIASGFAWTLCFSGVVIGWVFFRAANVDVALKILSAMFLGAGPAVGSSLPTIGIPTDMSVLATLAILMISCLWVPNVFELFSRYGVVSDGAPRGCEQDRRLAIEWRPSLVSSLVLSFAAVLALLHLSRVSEFLYFQF